jgi:simple sugar transport system ATP-binding protein
VVGATKPAETNEAKLAAMMVGREVILKVDRGPAHPTDEVLNVNDLKVADDRGVMTVNGATFSVRAGEVLGIAGVQGNGQTQLVEALTGLRKVASGSIHLLGADVTKSSPRTITELGSAHIPEDRQRHGLVLAYPLTDNMVLNTYYQQPFARNTIMDEARIKQNADQLVGEFDVRTPASTVAVKTLSGGNQQKVIVAREFSRPIKLLIANQPTRGLDVGSIEYIHRRIIEKRDDGCAVLLVSAELDEILALSDRIAVMYHGRIVAILPSAEATREKLGLLMAGIN